MSISSHISRFSGGAYRPFSARSLSVSCHTVFICLFIHRSRSEIVATFIAVLELCRAAVIRLAGSQQDCTVKQLRDLPEDITF